jgi:UDP-2,4-diacetamido-2,4,6-trideoxy-beta-L-altropyranose hydrolase
MNIVFRVDSSTQIGAGHLMRCLTLADELKKQAHNIVFICRELNGNLISLIKHKVLTLPVTQGFLSNDFYLNWLGATQEDDAKQTIEVLSKNIDLLIVDSYGLGELWHQQLRKFTQKIMVIDDLANRQFDCDILLNQNLGSKKEEYVDKVSESCQLLLGCDYALLRSEFVEFRGEVLAKRQQTKVIKHILISMGGSDSKNLTYEVLQQLDNNFNIIVVLGSVSPHNEMIENYAKNKKNIKVIIDADNMAELMFNADLAIGAGGSTSWERCCLALPTLLFVTAENQRKIVQNLEKLGAVKIVKQLKDDLKILIDNFAFWQEMSQKSQTICDGLGVKKVGSVCS